MRSAHGLTFPIHPLTPDPSPPAYRGRGEPESGHLLPGRESDQPAKDSKARRALASRGSKGLRVRCADMVRPPSRVNDPTHARPVVEQLYRFLEEFGRDRASFGFEARIPYGDGNPKTWETLIKDWEQLGATTFSVNTMGVGLDSPQAHMAAVKEFSKLWELRG